jgi:AcrR family transcriptional regulator
MQKRSLETRNCIMNAALACFARAGYAATGVAEICDTAGVSKGAFYHHFPSKQSVFLALLQDWLLTIDTLLEASRQKSQSIPQALRQMSEMMTGVFAQAGGRLPMFLEFWTQANHDPLIWQAIIEPYQRYETFFCLMIKQGIAEGSLKPVDADNAARTIVSLALGLLLQGLLDPTGAQWGLVTQQSIQFLLDGIST